MANTRAGPGSPRAPPGSRSRSAAGTPAKATMASPSRRQGGAGKFSSLVMAQLWADEARKARRCRTMSHFEFLVLFVVVADKAKAIGAHHERGIEPDFRRSIKGCDGRRGAARVEAVGHVQMAF